MDVFQEPFRTKSKLLAFLSRERFRVPLTRVQWRVRVNANDAVSGGLSSCLPKESSDPLFKHRELVVLEAGT